MSMTLFLILLFSLTTFYFIVGLFASRKVSTVEDYFLASRSVGVFALTFTLVATQLGSGLILGTAARAYSIGLWGILYTLGISIGFLLLGFGFAAKLQSLNISTTAEIFETHYHSPRLKLFASMISIVSLWGILIAQIIASHQLFISIGVLDVNWLIGFWIMLVVYTMLGGLRSIIMVNAVQVIFILTVFIIVFANSWTSNGMGTLTIPLLVKMQGYYFSKKYVLATLLPVVFSSALYSLIEQDLAQKFFAAKTKATATIAAFLATIIVTLFACIPLSFGIVAKIKNIPMAPGVNPLLSIIEKTNSELMYVLVVCALIAAIASTADSLLCAISSNISQDFSKYFPRQKLYASKCITLMTGILALVVSFFITQDIIAILEQSYRLSIGCIFVPTVLAYFTKNVKQGGAVAAIACGAISFVGVHLFLPHSIWQDIIPLGLSLLGYVIGAILSEK